jgi:hypothetical protein
MHKLSITKLFILLATTTAPVSVNAFIITDHLGVNGTTSVGTGISSTPIQGNVLVDTGFVTANNTTVHGDYIASGRAQSGIGSGLKAMANSRAPTIPSGPVNSTISSSVFQSSWRDVLTVTGGAAPSDLRFNFHVDALLTSFWASSSGVLLFDNFSRGGVSVAVSPDVFLFPPATPAGTSAFVESVELSFPATGTNESGLTWDSTSFVSTDIFNHMFDGTFSLLSPFLIDPIDLPGGGYYMSVSLSAFAETRGGAAAADAFSTLTLVSVTLADGSPLPAELGLAFESGAPIPIVPAPAPVWLLGPAAVWLLGICLLGLSGMAKRKKA